MSKWKCHKAAGRCIVACCVELDTEEFGPPEGRCLFDDTRQAVWERVTEEQEQTAKNSVQLPKLTAEVFDRPDCPEWAEFAAVDVQGLAYWYQHLPLADERIGIWSNLKNKRQLINQLFDSSDWKNSLIERPAKLPDWCKEGEWVYVDDYETDSHYYVKITEAGDDFIRGVSGCAEFYADGHFELLKQARLRPYSAEEMRGLVGKAIERHSSAYLVISYAHDDLETTVYIEGKYLSADNLLRDFTINGKPCGVLEHLENGEWVK